MSGADRHLGALDWARHSAGELRGWTGWRIRRHLRCCDTCWKVGREIASERVAFLASPESASDLSKLEARARTLAAPSARSWRPLALSIGGTAAVAATMSLWVHLAAPATRGLLRGKGGDELTLFVEAPAGAVALGPSCAPGDRLIARYRTDRAYLLVLERDGQGAVQVVHPWNGDRSARLPAGEGTAPLSWVLDDVQGPECFVAFFSDEAVEAGRAREAVTRAPEAPDVGGAAVRIQCCEKRGSR